MIRFACPTCSFGLSAPTEKAGAQTSCPKCRGIVIVPTKGAVQEELLEVLPANWFKRQWLGMPVWAWALLAALVPLMLVSALLPRRDRDPAGVRESKDDDYDLSTYSSNMMIDYRENGVAADRKYKGKVLRVQGHIIAIDKGVSGKAYVLLGTGDGELEVAGVQCFFSKRQEGEAARLSNGQVVTIQGKCRGKTWNIVLDGCSLR